MSLKMNAEQSTRYAQRRLFRRFLATISLCFAIILLGIGMILAYQLDKEEKKLMRSLGAEYQRILKFESDDKMQHVVVNNPYRLIENAISVVSNTDDGSYKLVSGAMLSLTGVNLSQYQLSQRDWYELLTEPAYYAVSLPGQQQHFWLVLNLKPRLNLLYQQWVWIAIALAALCSVISLIVWRLIRSTLAPLHSLAKGIDQASTWSLDAMSNFIDHDLESTKGELGVLNQSVNQVLGRLKATISSMGNTLDAIAHDLRTPLSRIVLSTEKSLLSQAQGDELKQQMQAALSDCAESAQHASKMLNTLMKINDEIIGKHQLQPQPIELKAFIENIGSWYEELSEETCIPVSMTGLHSCHLITEPNRLTQILVNLIDNSFKYSHAGDQILLECGNDKGGQVVIKVSDTGIGIAKEHHELIFRRLYRVDQSRSKSGYGLGLALVKVMLKTLNGHIKLDSEVGKGTCFQITLPAALRAEETTD
ncbi:HAMP domain-containing sensor histidine kinase [Photobacterium sp.]|uniref:sensor histidine kinase n=1 Tax=Photobacterium sp. TaxID=660 RepID=UPI00299EA6EB|nr:HAMP domain-containing sensor histidine kinase [Photobacterium sp.]MDX1302985.1 HAMP domain-containing sensor histidine kinase [Photobacterium sp.]